ncbi:hypothetical protein B0I33_105478 [Prauserella shujinwangii]|uniref:Uncharacterized protein n=1 Tax=Prauserella shujinwangii TaxID=1453103 RepID=A0A2T0LVP3_9PSEU|nr:hypothetical protein [Prauserella shujinwangii]PRX47894.1 hypothetical protein B0I33_105478 [Prauserella shujinwangii]
MSLIGDDPSTDNVLVDDKTDATSLYDSLSSGTSAAAGLALVASGLNPAMLAVTVPLGAATGQFDNMGGATELAQGTTVSTVIDATNQIKDGDWASAVTSGSAVAADVVGAVADPIAAVAGPPPAPARTRRTAAAGRAPTGAGTPPATTDGW